MNTYSQFSPTAFDRKGISLPDRQDWIVAPCTHNRDSGPATQSNWFAQLKALGGESNTVEIHRFGHWGPGWFEIVLVAPNSPQAAIAEQLEASLEDYPLLDDTDCSEREYDDYTAAWTACGVWRDFIKAIRGAFQLADSTYYAMEDFDHDTLRNLYEELIPSGDYYETCDNGANFGNRVNYAVNRLTRDRLAAFLKANRP